VDREQLLSRIQNLLNKTVANGATEAEAEAAMVAAQKLMDRYNIALAEIIDHDETAVSFDNEVVWEGKSVSSLYDAATRIIDKVFAVRTMIVKLGIPPIPEVKFRGKTLKVQVILVGDPTNIEAARWALRFLVDTFGRLWDAYCIRTGERDRYAYRGYIGGLVDGFLAKLREERAESERGQARSANALVPLNTRLDEAFRAFEADFKKVERDRSSVDPFAYEEGCRAGRDINLARPIEKAAPRKLRKLGADSA
jgi:hypothetical protein